MRFSKREKGEAPWRELGRLPALRAITSPALLLLPRSRLSYVRTYLYRCPYTPTQPRVFALDTDTIISSATSPFHHDLFDLWCNA